MKKRPFFSPGLAFVTFITLFSFAGCAARRMELTRTGFLSGYSGLREDEESEGMRIYKNPDVDIGERYSKVLIAPVQFKLNPAGHAHMMNDEDQEKLAGYFHEQLKLGLEKNYGITDEPGEDVLLFRTAITDVLPNKVYLNLHWSTTLIGAGIGGASLEAELVDSLTGERMMAFVDARKGRKFNLPNGYTKWGHTKEVLKIWADIIVMNLERLKGKYQAGGSVR